MDIEGSEYFALLGMQEILSLSQCLVVEFAPHHLRNISGATPEQFIELLAPHFQWLWIPNHSRLVDRHEMAIVARSIFDANESHDAILFIKSIPTFLSNRNHDDNNSS
jgi:hypothetical protein